MEYDIPSEKLSRRSNITSKRKKTKAAIMPAITAFKMILFSNMMHPH
jgi:hypothetical protein